MERSDFSKEDLTEVFKLANEYYMSKDLDRRLNNEQQIARCYVEAIALVLERRNAEKIVEEIST
jgi:hypothetical protein